MVKVGDRVTVTYNPEHDPQEWGWSHLRPHIARGEAVFVSHDGVCVRMDDTIGNYNRWWCDPSWIEPEANPW